MIILLVKYIYIQYSVKSLTFQVKQENVRPTFTILNVFLPRNSSVYERKMCGAVLA